MEKKKFAPEYDGLCFKKPNKFDDETKADIVFSLNKLIREKTGLEVNMKFKDYKDENICFDIIEKMKTLPQVIEEKKIDDIANYEEETTNYDDDIESPKAKNMTDNSFTAVCARFEETHTKISNVSMFVETHPDGDVIYTKQGLITTFEHMIYSKVSKNDDGSDYIITKNFIKDWLRNNPTQKIKRKMESFPHDVKCPDDIYNLWRPFTYDREIPNYIYDEDAVNVVLNHIKILTGHHDHAWNYTLDCIASCIQFPSKKLTMPVFVSEEGSGKGTLVRLFVALLGKSKILETQKPSEEVWGQFNALMTNAYIVVLDEISKKEMSGCEGMVKGLITEPTMRINDKGKSRFEMTSHHKFISLSNPDEYGNEPMTTTKDDRRKYFMKCSDELKGNRKYFDDFYAMLENENQMKSVFEYFKNREITLLHGPLPLTDYNKELKALGTPVLKQFIKDCASDLAENEITSADLFDTFLKWIERNKMRYECNSQQFACRFANLRLKGMTKANHVGDKRLKGWNIDKQVLYEELEIGCMILPKPKSAVSNEEFPSQYFENLEQLKEKCKSCKRHVRASGYRKICQCKKVSEFFTETDSLTETEED